MAATATLVTPSLESYLKSLKHRDVEASIESLTSLLKRRQIRGSRACAIATARLMMQVVRHSKRKDTNALIERVSAVGGVLTKAQPREIAVGNVVRRILAVIRTEAEEDREAEGESVGEGVSGSGVHTPWELSTASLRSGELATALALAPSTHLGTSEISVRPSLGTSNSSYQPSGAASVASMFDLLSASQLGTPGTQSPTYRGSPIPGTNFGTNASSVGARTDTKAEVMEGINEIIDELSEADDQIAAYALEHIHAAETILVHGASTTVQKFLLRAAAKRKFTVIHAESYPNNHNETYTSVTGKRTRSSGNDGVKPADADGNDDEDRLDGAAFVRPLIAAGITVVLIPDSALFALLSRVNKVLLGTHGVLANGGLVAAAGSRVVAQAAHAHRTPVVVVTGVYKLSPLYPFDFDALIEHGDASPVIPFADGGLANSIDVANPLFDYVPPELVDLYVTNLGGHAPSYLYRIVAEHYRKEDTNLA